MRLNALLRALRGSSVVLYFSRTAVIWVGGRVDWREEMGVVMPLRESWEAEVEGGRFRRAHW